MKHFSDLKIILSRNKKRSGKPWRVQNQQANNQPPQRSPKYATLINHMTRETIYFHWCLLVRKCCRGLKSVYGKDLPKEGISFDGHTKPVQILLFQKL